MKWVYIHRQACRALDCKLAEDVYSKHKTLLLKEGTVVTAAHIQLLFQHGISRIAVGGQASVLEQLEQKWEGRYSRFVQAYRQQFEEIKRVFAAAADGTDIDLTACSDQFEKLAEEALASGSMLVVLQQLQGHSDYTYRHSIHVGMLSALIARLADFPHDLVMEIGKAGLYHDIGKLQIAKEIIQKPAKLTPEEFEKMKQHPQLGVALLKKNGEVPRMIHDGVLDHHERVDGSGYPRGLQGEDLSAAGLIVAVADVFDAVSSDRSYQKKSSPFRALRIVTEDIFSGKLSSRFGLPFTAQMLQLYTGADVYLSDGRLGTIIQLFPDDLEHPLVLVGQDAFNLRGSGLAILDVADRRSWEK
ncbi:HD-GYP domain-containing protein [Alkalicoccus luteus]|uniref:HD-GYP domain-containing protein n=1 Tax=Alkalicoccus luteus TaxID=1237094 RepID=UPI00403415B0